MDPISVVGTAINIVKFIVEWKREYANACESIKTLGATIDVVHAALVSLDPIRHPQLNTPLRTLVDCLNETKDILVTHTKKATKFGKVKKIVFPSSVTKRMEELEATIIKLVSIMNLAVSAQTLSVATNFNDTILSPQASHSHIQPQASSPYAPPPYNPSYAPPQPQGRIPADVFMHEETRKFWLDWVGTMAYQSNWAGFEGGINSHYFQLMADPILLTKLRDVLDNERTGFVTCTRLSDFCGPLPLSKRLQDFKDNMKGGFQSGTWAGYYEYKNGLRESTMFDVTMVACIVSGSGSDNVGPFVIKGSYDGKTLGINWQKIYTGKHTVYYSGQLDATNTIRGSWTIGQQYMGGTFVLQHTNK